MHGPRRKLDEGEGKPGRLAPVVPLSLVCSAHSEQPLPCGSQLLAGCFLIQPEAWNGSFMFATALIATSALRASLHAEVPVFSSLCLRYKNGVVFLTDMLICTDTAHLLGLVWDDGYLIIADGEKVGRQEKASLLRWAHLPGIATTEWITPHANYFSFVTHYSYSLCDPG